MQIKELLNRKFEVTGDESQEYGMYVDMTAKLLKKPFIAVHKMVEDWPLEKIKSRYHEAEKIEGMPRDVWWFWKRKQDKELSTPSPTKEKKKDV